RRPPPFRVLLQDGRTNSASAFSNSSWPHGKTPAPDPTLPGRTGQRLLAGLPLLIVLLPRASQAVRRARAAIHSPPADPAGANVQAASEKRASDADQKHESFADDRRGPRRALRRPCARRGGAGRDGAVDRRAPGASTVVRRNLCRISRRTLDGN